MLIRSAGPGDAEAVAALYRPIVENTTISFEVAPPDPSEMRGRIAEITRRYPWLVATQEDGRMAGFAYASPHRARAAYATSVDVSVYIEESLRRRGIAGALYAELFVALTNAGRFHRAFAGIALPNEASVAFHRRVGFEPVGVYREVGFKFGRWIDVSWWQRGIGN